MKLLQMISHFLFEPKMCVLKVGGSNQERFSLKSVFLSARALRTRRSARPVEEEAILAHRMLILAWFRRALLNTLFDRDSFFKALRSPTEWPSCTASSLYQILGVCVCVRFKPGNVNLKTHSGQTLHQTPAKRHIKCGVHSDVRNELRMFRQAMRQFWSCPMESRR